MQGCRDGDSATAMTGGCSEAGECSPYLNKLNSFQKYHKIIVQSCDGPVCAPIFLRSSWAPVTPTTPQWKRSWTERLRENNSALISHLFFPVKTKGVVKSGGKKKQSIFPSICLFVDYCAHFNILSQHICCVLS